MLSKLKHRALKKRDRQNFKQDQIASHIFITTIRFQEKCAAFLQRKTNRLSKSFKIFLLVAFCCFSFGYSFYHLKSSVTNYSRSYIPVKQLLKNGSIYKSDSVVTPRKQMAIEEYDRIQQFLHYMDSLNQTASGRKTKDSILRLHPGLTDSIQYVNRIFQSQSN